MPVESSLSHSYYYDDGNSVEQDIRAAEQAHRIHAGMADYLLGEEPLAEGVSDYDIRRILSVIACTGFMDDPVVMKNFRVLQNRLLKEGDINKKLAEDSKESHIVGVGKRTNSTSRVFLENSGLGSTPGWFKRAECLGVGAKKFFSDVALYQYRALRYCADCKVRDECGEFGKNENFGIWGGVVMSNVKKSKVKKSV